jgi:putative oxidoreductase
VKSLDDAGKLLVRAVPAVLMLLHGVHKLGHGVAGIVETMTRAGLPGFFAYGVYLGEVVAPILMLVGYLSRPAGVVFAFNMIVAVCVAHSADVFHLGKNGQWPIELNALYFTAGIAVAIFGPGRYSVSRGKTRLG